MYFSICDLKLFLTWKICFRGDFKLLFFYTEWEEHFIYFINITSFFFF